MTTASEDEKVLPLWTETLDLTKQSRLTARVTVSTVTRYREELIEELLTREHADIERVEIRQLVDAPPDIRYEVDTIVIPGGPVAAEPKVHLADGGPVAGALTLV